MTTTTKFGDRLRSLRDAHNLSQRELAAWLGCDYTYISKLENGKADYPPSERLLRQMSVLFQVDAEELMFLAGKIPERYEGLLAELAIAYGSQLPEALEKLLKDRPSP